MEKIVDIYMPLDARPVCCATVRPFAQAQLKILVDIITEAGWEVNLLNGGEFVMSVAEGIETVKEAKGSRFINFMAGWAYPDFTVSPMWQLDKDVPKMLLGSAIPDFPGAVGLLAAASGTENVGIRTSRLFVPDFDDVEAYKTPLLTFLETGKYAPEDPKFIDVEVTDEDVARAKKAKELFNGQLYGCVGPRSMEMWNKIPDSDFLKYFGVAKLGFDGIRLVEMAKKIPTEKAEKAVDFLIENGMELKLGTDPKEDMTRDQVVFQMKVYYAWLELKEEFGLDFGGQQDQLDWIQHYPATDLTLGILNNRLRPDSDGETFVIATEGDDGAALTMQLFKHLNNGEPAGFNDLRYWEKDSNIYYLVNSGALAPYFAEGSNDSLKGSWSERQTAMYMPEGGGTSSVVVRKGGVMTWARFGHRDGQLYLCGGRGVTDVPTEEEWLKRTERCSRDWPQWYIKPCSKMEQYINSNHPMTAFGDHLGALKAFADEIGIPFECYDHVTPEQV